MNFNGQLLSGDDVIADITEGKVKPIIENRLPLYLKRKGDFEKWLESRAVDRHRPNSRILKKVLRLSDTSDLMTAIYAHAATITDNFWIREINSVLTYDDVRYNENMFADIALVGDVKSYNKSFSNKELRSKTPELTNTGSFEKCWRLEKGSWIMYKRGNALERFSELFISKLANELGFDTAKYFVEGDYIKTPDFTMGKYNFEPMSSLVDEDENYIKCYDILKGIDESLALQYLDVLFTDTICMNMDRHTNNFGLLRDGQTGEIIKMAPNFDNNIALISRGYLEDGAKQNNLLVELFNELINERNICYSAPEISKEKIKEIAKSCDIGGEIDIEYVTNFVSNLYDRTLQILMSANTQQQNATIEMKF